MKFFDLELGGLGSKPQNVLEQGDGYDIYIGGTGLLSCAMSKKEFGAGVIRYTTSNSCKSAYNNDTVRFPAGVSETQCKKL